MAIYSAKEMKDRMNGGNKKIREFELVDGKTVKLWIPKNEFYYEKKHFNIKMIERFENATVKAVTCINSETKVADCPVCEYIQELWADWKVAKSNNDKDGMKKLQGVINRLSADFYYVNVIDLADKSCCCYSLRLTSAMFNNIMKVVCPEGETERDINRFVWTIKKVVTNTNTKYIIMEDDGSENPTLLEEINKRIKNLDKICNREESKGGYIDLEKAYNRNVSVDEYYKKLFGNNVEDDDEDDKASTKKTSYGGITITDDELSLDEIDEEKPVKKSPKKESKKPAVDDDLDLDDMDEEPEEKPAKKPVSKPAKKPVVDDDDLDLDDIDEEPVKPVKKESKKPVVAEDDEDLDLDEEPEVKPSKPVQKKKPVEVDDDDLDLDDMDEEPEEKPAKKPVSKPVSKPAKKLAVDDYLDDVELEDIPF